MHQNLKSVDPEIFAAIREETRRQSDTLEMIASENFVSTAVMEAQGSVMTNKYAEGYPKARYYSGCHEVDKAENLARDRVKQLFNCKFANVQPHSGSQANMAAYLTIAKPGDTIMGLKLDHGGHLTHGSGVNFSGRLYKFVSYGLDPITGRIDYDEMAKLAKEHKPKVIVTGASAYPRVIDFPKVREIANSIGAFHMSDIAHIAGLVATGIHPSPLPYADIVTSTTHKTLRGPRGGLILSNYEGGEFLLENMPKPKTLAEAIDAWVFPGCQGGPLMHVIAAKAVAFKEALDPQFKVYQRQIVKNAATLAEHLMNAGFKLVSDGTDNHLMVVDLSPKGITGKAAALALDHAGITVSKSTVPNDPQKPFITSGVRIGTPALTTRGMKEAEMEIIGGFITDVLSHMEDEKVIASVRTRVGELTAKFPLYTIPE